MIENLRQLINDINTLPEYFCKGMLELLVLIIGGLIVGWITSTYFAQKAAESEVKGDIMKKKLDIYETLVAKLDAMLQLSVFPAEIDDMAIKQIRKHNIAFRYVSQYPIMTIFQTGEKLSEIVLDIDRYLSSNRIFFDGDLCDKLQFFQNYLVVFNRFIVLYKEQFVNAGISLDNEQVRKFEDLTTIEIGLILQDELAEEIQIVFDSIKNSMSNIKFKSHANSDRSNNRLEVDGPIMQKMLNMKVMKERENIILLITENVALGMVSVEQKL